MSLHPFEPNEVEIPSKRRKTRLFTRIVVFLAYCLIFATPILILVPAIGCLVTSFNGQAWLFNLIGGFYIVGGHAVLLFTASVVSAWCLLNEPAFRGCLLLFVLVNFAVAALSWFLVFVAALSF